MFSAGKQGLAQLRRSQVLLSTKRLSSLPDPAFLEHVGPESVQLSPGGLTLMGLQDRVWGATSILPVSALPPGEHPPRVAVVRDAFAAAQDSARTLSGSLVSLGPSSVALSSDLSQHHRRLIVDEYERGPAGTYVLRTVGTELLRLLKREGVRVAHVPDVRAAGWNSVRAAASGVGARQSTNEVLMVAPTAFEFNQQTAQDNSFMHSTADDSEEGGGGRDVARRVLREFSGLYRELSEVAGIRINLFQHSHSHGTPDAVFPNNWFSTHAAGEAAGGTKESTLVFYPMKCPNRAMERRLDMQGVLRSKRFGRVVDLSSAEKEGKPFEGTGVLVLDRVNGVAYVALSERADEGIARHWVEKLGYKDLVTFHSSDTEGRPVYHTNVMMAIGTDVAVVCLESVRYAGEREHLRSRLATHHEVVEISREQMASLCGNILELEDGRGLPVLAMSTRAFQAFTPEQRKVLRRHVAELHHAPIDTLEYIGGGGVRCALGEIFT